MGGGAPEARLPCIVFRADGGEQEKDCNYVSLCASLAYDCDGSSCQAKPPDPSNELWIARVGDSLIGHLSRAVFDHGVSRPMPIGAIRFERVLP